MMVAMPTTTAWSSPAQRLACVSFQRVRGVTLCADPARTFGRCEPWAPERATTLEVINIIGRFEESSQWSARTEFATPDASESTTAQAATEKRREFAQKYDQAERLAFNTNVPTLPFVDAPLAASVGRTVDDFATMEITPAHLSVVFDALANSKTTLVSKDAADERIKAWRTADGGFDAEAFGGGLRKGLVAVLAANAVLYFFIASGIAVVARVALDVV